MSLVQKFFESTYEESLSKKFEDYFTNANEMSNIQKVEASDTDGAYIEFPNNVFPDNLMKAALEEINKDEAKKGFEAYVMEKTFKHFGTQYDIEEKPIEYQVMKKGTLDFSGGWDTHYRFEDTLFGVELPDGEKVVYVKTKEISSELTHHGIGQMLGHHDKWLFEPADNNPEHGYFIVSKDVVHPYAGEDCIATWYSGKYGDEDSVTAGEYFGEQEEGPWNYNKDKPAPMNEKEAMALKRVFKYFIDNLGFSPDVFGDGFGHFKDENDLLRIYEDYDFESCLEAVANEVEDYFDENPQAKNNYGSYSEDGEYLPFTVDDLYEIDAMGGDLDLPKRK